MLLRLCLLYLFFCSSKTMETPAWETALSQLPKTDRIPAFFFAHGSPILIYPENRTTGFPQELFYHGGPRGPLAQFLRFFGPFLLKTYKPKALVVFSAHWEAENTIEVMDNEENPLFYDYYGFPKELYEIKWKSFGSSEIANKVVELLQKNNIPAKKIKKQSRGIDHGVFVPFTMMFPDGLDIPLVEVSLSSNLDPQYHIDIGKALTPLRDEGVLILSGGLTIHTFKEFNAFSPSTAPQGFKDFEKEIISSVETATTASDRNEKLKAITKHPFFRRAHPREEHFIPIYVAAGAGSDGGASVITKIHGCISIAFGL